MYAEAGVIVKTRSTLLLLSLLLLAGCARNYIVTLNNGSRITATTKPRLQNGYYVFKDASGRTVARSAGSVVEIAPASMATDIGQTQFLPKGE